MRLFQHILLGYPLEIEQFAMERATEPIGQYYQGVYRMHQNNWDCIGIVFVFSFL